MHRYVIADIIYLIIYNILNILSKSIYMSSYEKKTVVSMVIVYVIKYDYYWLIIGLVIGFRLIIPPIYRLEYISQSKKQLQIFKQH
uniref:Uncharacterized protein n=1 Tax=Octopus bimaculoides TaxID=37653 RepID=A0A0L8FU18_OCTBM